MLKPLLTLMGALAVWTCCIPTASARPNDDDYYYRDRFYRNDFALSIERFMGIDLTDWQEPRDSEVTARILINASEPTVATSAARLGFDYFISRLSLGVAAGFTSEDVVLLAPRVGYMFGLSRTVGVWLRGGMFVSENPGPDYVGISFEAYFHWWAFPNVSLHLGPTLDFGFTDDRGYDFVNLGIPEMGLTLWF